MVAQDYLSFFISIGTYDAAYLKYIFGLGSQPVLPIEGSTPFLKIQEFGPFRVEKDKELKQFLHIMLRVSFLLWQLEMTNEGATYKEVLGY